MVGFGRRSDVSSIRATAIVALYDEAGRAAVNEQRHVFDLRAGALTASAKLPHGNWTAKVSQNGPPAFRSNVALSGEQRQRLLDALTTILRRVRGPSSLAEGARAGKPKRVRIEAMELIRVAGGDGRGGAAAYYFDAKTHILRLASAGGDAPGQEGTVTRYTYRMFPNGIAFPSRLAVMRIGKHVLIGDRPVVEVDYHGVQFSR